MIQMEEEKLWRECIFFRKGNMQHTRGGWMESHSLRYNLYMVPKELDLEDTISFAYGDLMQHEQQKDREIFPGDVCPLYLFDKKLTADKNMSG